MVQYAISLFFLFRTPIGYSPLDFVDLVNNLLILSGTIKHVSGV